MSVESSSHQPPSADAVVIECLCGASNQSNRKFCKKCGESLWRQCASCSARCAVDELHCGGCGVNLEQAAERRRQQLQQRLEAIQRAASQHRYDEALADLRRLPADDPWLLQLLPDREQLGERLESQQVKAKAKADQLLAQGRDCLEGHDLDGAVERLKSIPEGLRRESHKQALAEAERRWEVCREQEKLLRQLIAAKQYRQLADPIDQLLGVKPDHVQALKLCGQVRDQLCSQAQQRFKAADDDDALKLLDAIPAAGVTETVQKLRRMVVQRRGLVRDLRSATVVGPNHLAALETLAATSESIGAIHQQAQRAWREGGAAAITAWRTPPERTAVGCPVDWTLHPQLPVAEPCRPSWNEHPGKLFCAAGLALQALGRGSSDLNFASEGDRRPLSGLLKRRKTPQSAWGVDVGGDSIKAVHVTLGEDGSPTVDHVKVTARTGGDGELEQLLARMKDELNWEDAQLGTSVPSLVASVRSLPLPPLEDKQLETAIAQEAQRLFPMGDDQIQWRCDVRTVEGRKIGVWVALKRSAAEQALAPWRAVGIAPNVLTVNSLAVRTAWTCGGGQETVGLLDVGRSSAQFSFSSGGRLWVRALPCGGDRFTSAIVRHTQLTRDQAERAKIDFAQVKSQAPLVEAMRPVHLQLQQEINRTLEAVGKEDAQARCERIVCLGGGALLMGLIDGLRLT